MGRKRKGVPIHGWLNINKPLGMTSSQVVGAVRRITGAEKAGHGGTLDPLATGVLPIALGEATKTVSYVMDGRKSYGFRVRWGAATTTDDREGPVVETSDLRPEGAAIEALLPDFIGEIEQVPPAFSAIKVDGERAYDLARDGEEVQLASRRVRVDRLALVGQPDADCADFEVECGKGTYVRSLGRDMGRLLGCLGHIEILTRLKVGRFALEKAISLDSLEALAQSAAPNTAPQQWMGPHLLPVETALDDIPALLLSELEANRLRHGQTVPLLRKADRARIDGLDQVGSDGIAFAMTGNIPVAIVLLEGGQLHPVRVLNLKNS
jgi:tRNA pseudouridine55 synthase